MAAQQVLLATSSAGKLRELRQMTAGCAWDWIGLEAYPDIAEAIEDGETFAENARIKALHYARLTRLATLADDSGICVDALGGAPGIHSARYAGRPRDDDANNRKLVAALQNLPNARRAAHFECHMAFAIGDSIRAETNGVVAGRIIDEPRGRNGFGYDPYFLIPDLGRTTAELPSSEKNAISHRGQALRAMLPQIERLLAQ